jgi:DNA-binding NarL/FixJ family response regulator
MLHALALENAVTERKRLRLSGTTFVGGGPSPTAAGAFRLLVVEDHPLFRDALVDVVSTAFPDAQILQATSIDGALDVLAARGAVDLVLLDLSMPGTTGLLGAFRIRLATPRSALVIVSAHEDLRIIGSATALGIAGYIPKSTPKAELAELIRSILDGAICFPKRYQDTTAAKRARADAKDLLGLLGLLTFQQLRVLEMICRGLQNKHIAYELGISVTTVKVHVSEVLRKLGVRSRTEAIVKMSALDFTEPR